MRYRISMPVAIVLTIAALPAPGAVAAQEAGSITCLRQGHVMISPGLTFDAQDFTFDEVGTFGPCFGPGGPSSSTRVTTCAPRSMT
jgi:hypothetical protein